MCKRLMAPILLVTVLGMARAGAQDVQWTRAAYWDARYPTAWADNASSIAVRDGLQAAGYEILDADQLKTWMDARIADKTYSVVVFCRDNPPDTVTETKDVNCTLRKYLNAGGKIVVYADIPFYNQGHADGTTTTWAESGINSILGIGNVAIWDTNQQVTITAAGTRWGLTRTWGSLRPNAKTDVSVVLATDAAGNAAAWVKHYLKGDTFRGFVRLYDRTGQVDIGDLIRVAEFIGFKAYNPSPENGATGVSSPILMWNAGTLAVGHNVYLGTSPELGEADFRGRQPVMGTAYWHQPGFTAGTTYYWRIDEIAADGAVRTGDVWSFFVTPQMAWSPRPMDGAQYVSPDVSLEWSPGMAATEHGVYFGTDRAAVEAGTGDTFKGNQLLASYVPAALERGATYFWRVDEAADGGTVTGSVWSFTVQPVLPKTNPDLIGWWKLDDEKSGTAVDYSGWDYYGAIMGDPQWVEGYHGDALDFDGQDDFVDLGNPPTWPTGTASRSLCGWARTDTVASGWRWIAAYGSPATGQAMFIGINGTDLYGGGYGDDVFVTGFWEVGVWHHIALTYDGTTARLYADGVEVTSAGKAWNLVASRAHIGRQVNSAVEFWDGMIDDVRVYNVALTAEQVRETMRGDPRTAWNPQPAPGVNVDILDATELSWSAGDGAAQHDVYLGKDKDAVKTATVASPLYLGRQTGTSFSLDGHVEFGGGPYFWRIDEVEADGTTVNKGVVWGFTIPDYLIIDEFESYTDEEGNRIYQTWTDGMAKKTNGSVVGNMLAPFAERTIVHGGKQAMPLDYNNTDYSYSEAELELPSVENWNDHGVDRLSLWFRGIGVAYLERGADAFTMSAGGNDIWDVADQFRFAYRRLNGNGSIVARVDSVVQTDGWAKAGVMIRETLDPSSKHAAVVVTPSNGVSFPYRAFTADVSNQVNIGGVRAPYWVRLTRTGDVFKAEHSADGVTWTLLGTEQTISMTGSIYIGLCLTSHNTAVPTTAEYSGVATTNATGAWQMAEIGTDHPGNSQDALYVTLEDSTGKTRTLVHPDPAAVLTTTWTEWPIPLSDITGISLSKVKKVYVGVGSRSGPITNSTGRIYIDDIRLLRP